MSDDQPSSASPSSPSARRSSFSSTQRMSGFFGRSPTNNTSAAGSFPGPIATAAAQAHAQQRRRTSLSSLGLSGSPTQSAFAAARARQSSVSSGGTSNTIDESAIEDGDAPPTSASPTSSYGRRLSFGAEALRRARAGNNGNGKAPTKTINHSRSPSSPHDVGRSLPESASLARSFPKRFSNKFSHQPGEGFNWSEQLRSRAERSSSLTSPPSSIPAGYGREQSKPAGVAASEQPLKTPASPRVPDQFQERILKGDFYMD